MIEENKQESKLLEDSEEHLPLGIPKDFKGYQRRRDYLICTDYINGQSPEEIKRNRKLSLSVRTIQDIVYKHASYVNTKIAWPKFKRIHKLQRICNRLEGNINLKKHDELDALEQLRKEIEGEQKGRVSAPIAIQVNFNLEGSAASLSPQETNIRYDDSMEDDVQSVDRVTERY